MTTKAKGSTPHFGGRSKPEKRSTHPPSDSGSFPKIKKNASNVEDAAKCIPFPRASVVEADGEDRVQMLLPIVEISETEWAAAFDATADRLASQLFRRGGHGRDLDEVRKQMLLHLDRSALWAWIGPQFITGVRREILKHLEINLDLRFERADISPSGLIGRLTLTSRLADAATIFNCNASVGAGRFESLRDRTAEMQPIEWGLMLAWFINFVNVVDRKEDHVHLRVFRELKEHYVLEQAMIRSIDEKGLKAELFGDFPLQMDHGEPTVH